jgi:hypothetical protein
MAAQADEDRLAEYERRAPGWVVRCKRCGFTQPWGKYGILIGAASRKKFTVGRCSRCGRIGCHAIEKREMERPGASSGPSGPPG